MYTQVYSVHFLKVQSKLKDGQLFLPGEVLVCLAKIQCSGLGSYNISY